MDCSSRDPNRRSFAGAGTRAHTSLCVRQICRRADDERAHPTTDGRELILERYTEPERDLNLLLAKLKLVLPERPPPKITAAPVLDWPVVQTFATV